MKKEKDWEKRFDKYFIDEYGKWKIGRVEVKSFIRTLLEEEKKKWVEKNNRLKRENDLLSGYKDLSEELAKALKQRIKKLTK